MITTTAEQRAQNESKFHDDISSRVDLSKIDVNKFFHASTAIESHEILRFFGDSFEGKQVLDLGCGYGEASAYFAKRGAVVDAIDVSDGMLKLAQQLADQNGVSPRFQRAPAEKLPYPDNTFDFVHGNGVLHHVTLDQAIPEIRRVLKPGGKAAFVEPLPYNPAINVYRRMATHYRTDDEQPLTVAQRRFVLKSFREADHKELWLTALVAFVWMYAVEKVHPNDAPFWKKIIYDEARYRFITTPLFALDRVLTRIPGVRWLSWNTVFLLQK